MIEMDRLGPFFHHGVYGLDCERRLRLATRKKIILIFRSDFLQVILKSSMDELIYHEDVLLPRLIFLYYDGLPGFEGFDILYLQPQKITDPKAVIDPHSKKEQIPWRPGENPLYGGNVFGVPYGIYPIARPFSGWLGI